SSRIAGQVLLSDRGEFTMKRFRPKFRDKRSSATERRRQKKPNWVTVPPARLVGRLSLLRALAEEYRFGDATSRLYVTLLARNVAALEPRFLERKHRRLLKSCGLFVDDPDEEETGPRCGVQRPVCGRQRWRHGFM